MIPSMFSLDHRLAELRPTARELRLARELAASADEVAQRERAVGAVVRTRLGGPLSAPGHSRLATD